MKKAWFLCGVVIACLFAGTGTGAWAQDAEPVPLLFFYSASCHNCHVVQDEVLPVVRERFGDRVRIDARDVSELEHYEYLMSLRTQFARDDLPYEVPVVVFGRTMLIGRQAIEEKLLQVIAADSRVIPEVVPPPSADVQSRFSQFTPLAVAAAGAADGVNPCAFTVIVFFVSYLAVQGYRKRELVIIGSSFITAVFATYLLIGLGLFNFLYRFKAFWMVTRGVSVVVGALSVLLGLLCLYDILIYRRTGKAEGMLLQLPGMVKHRIHGVIGHFWRRGKDQSAAAKPSVFALSVSALGTGLLVSVLEAVCTGQLYLPTIVFVFKTGSMKLRAFQYLTLYNIMFVVPLIIVFLMALLGTTSADFAQILRKHLILTKVLLAAVFIGLGLFLLGRM